MRRLRDTAALIKSAAVSLNTISLSLFNGMEGLMVVPENDWNSGPNASQLGLVMKDIMNNEGLMGLVSNVPLYVMVVSIYNENGSF